MPTDIECMRRPGVFSSSAVVSNSLMACVRLLDGSDVMTAAEYSLWLGELREQKDGSCFFDVLRRHLAKRFSAAIGTLFPGPPFLCCMVVH